MSDERTGTREGKQLGSLGPVDLWIRRTAILCVGLAAFKAILILTTEFWSKVHFAFEGWPGFYELTGFAGFALLVLIGRSIAGFVRRPEDYYDPESSRGEAKNA